MEDTSFQGNTHALEGEDLLTKVSGTRYPDLISYRGKLPLRIFDKTVWKPIAL